MLQESYNILIVTHIFITLLYLLVFLVFVIV